ncbi:hypothetical protein LTR08_008524 [Meristemomyces frigidus]|nr:hypothetical protein LTR08_008524 [Meristemomyces frigidus]
MLRSITLILSILAVASSACHPLLHARGTDPTKALNTTLGDSSYQPPETVGYNMNHFALTVPNLTRTMDFYVNALGFRHIFTAAVDDTHSITYLGYPTRLTATPRPKYPHMVLARLDTYNVNILKRVGEPVGLEAQSYFFGTDQFTKAQSEAFAEILAPYLLVLDPNGFLLEFEQQDY